jgi:hypothetical protein
VADHRQEHLVQPPRVLVLHAPLLLGALALVDVDRAADPAQIAVAEIRRLEARQVPPVDAVVPSQPVLELAGGRGGARVGALPAVGDAGAIVDVHEIGDCAG